MQKIGITKVKTTSKALKNINRDLFKMSELILLGFLILSLTICYTSGACEKREERNYICTDIILDDLKNVPIGVTRLFVKKARIPTLTQATFSRFSRSLISLKCKNCHIRNIESDAFRSMTQLRLLSLSYNQISFVNVSWILSLQRLLSLNLSHNKIKSIDGAVFHHLRNVRKLLLSGNPLQCLNLDALSKMTKLNTLNLLSIPHFQCPIAVTKFADRHKIKLNGHIEWKRKTTDTVSAYSNGTIETRTLPMEAVRIQKISSASSMNTTTKIIFLSFLLLISKTVFINNL